MKLWPWVSCGRCGFHGCAAPYEVAKCPKCLGPIGTPSDPLAVGRDRGERANDA